VLAFLIAGGSGPSARIELREGNRVITHWTGHDSEHFSPVLFDLGAFAGKQLNFAVIDESAEGWGHIMADGFMLLK
jgi:levanase